MSGGFSQVPLSSTHQFHTRTTPFQPSKPLSSTSKIPQFHPSQFHIKNSQFHSKNPSVQHTPSVPQRNSVSSPHQFQPPQFLIENPSVPHQKRVTVKLAYIALFWCGTDVLNWEGCWTEGDPFLTNLIEPAIGTSCMHSRTLSRRYDTRIKR